MRKIKNINGLKKSIITNILFISAGVIFFTLIIYNILYYQQYNLLRKTNEGRIESAINLYNANLSEKLSILSSSKEFIDYLRSGQLTRNENNLAFKLQIKNMKNKDIIGMKIFDDNNQLIFASGVRSRMHVSLTLCYLDSLLNEKYGGCQYKWLVYLKPDSLIGFLQKIDKNILICNKCKEYPLFPENKLGSFIVNDAAKHHISVKIYQHRYYYILINVLVLISIITLSLWFYRKINTILTHTITRPLTKITRLINENNYKNSEFDIEEIDILFKKLKLSFETSRQTKEQEKKIELGLLAEQVAHDIRSPLSALQILMTINTRAISEAEDILFRNAVNQIRDIINTLSYKNLRSQNSIIQLAILLEYIISESCIAFSESEVIITQNFPTQAYCLFVKTIPSEFRRVITNIINNAAEAIGTKKGVVQITLIQKNNSAVIKISDTGPGVPLELITSLFERGFTTKENGSGLGLYHAKETLVKFGGEINIHSEAGAGTCIDISLPLQPAPAWFVSKLIIPIGSKVICIDDSISIYNVWQEKFNQFREKILLVYFKDKIQLLHELQHESKLHRTYLVDYEFTSKNYTGLDLIEIILENKAKGDNIYLVTSRTDESHIQDFCLENKIYMIPKFFAIKIVAEVISLPDPEACTSITSE